MSRSFEQGKTVGGTYNNVGIIWVDTDVEVCWTNTDVEVNWTAPSAIFSEFRSIEVLEDVSVLSLVDCWQNKFLIFFNFTGFDFKLAVFTLMRRHALWYDIDDSLTFTKFK